MDIRKVVLRKNPSTVHQGGSIGVGLLGVNYHKINLTAGEDHLLYEGVVPFCGILFTPPR